MPDSAATRELTSERIGELARSVDTAQGAAQGAFRLLGAWFDPVFHGLDRIPVEGPVLLVGNHTVTGVWDSMLMLHELWRRRSLCVFALGDHFHFRIPVWRDVMESFAAVPGTRENCAALLRDRRHVLVYPGGGREVCKMRGEKYRLIWKERVGFARMAIDNGATVVPFAAVGGEEMYDIVIDTDDVMRSPMRPVVERLQRRLGVPADEIMPLVRGLGPLPRPTRVYFEFCEPIRTDRYGGRGDDLRAVWELRAATEGAVEAAILRLREEQGGDPLRDLAARVSHGVGRRLRRDPAGGGNAATLREILDPRRPRRRGVARLRNPL
ncbi:MAG: acyltransferase family protein [Acidimicrobiia bacterium]|nr:acyltransferase family protein [Acidimicrobiia bacterium]